MLEPYPSTKATDAPPTLDQTVLAAVKELLGPLEDEVRQGLFTAWAVATPRWAASCFFADEVLPPLEGNCEWTSTLHPRFDLASLTKPLFANALLRALVDDPQIVARMPLRELLAGSQTESGVILHAALAHSSLTLLDLMNHRAGLPAWRWFGRAQSCVKPVAALSQFLAEGLAREATDERYSDVGYYLLTRVIDELGTRRFPEWTWTWALGELNARNGNTRFVHASLDGEEARKAVPSFPYISMQLEDFPENSLAQHDFGVPHDTNANILAGIAGVSGHAGLFGSVLDVLAAARGLAETQRLWDPAPREDHRFAAGLDTPTGPSSTAAPMVWPMPSDERILGHLGFTGTALWFHTQGDTLRTAHAFLTNRTASRLVMGPVNTPRILVVSSLSHDCTQVSESASRYFVVGNELREIERNDAEETIVFHSRTAARLWNRSSLRMPPLIHSIRQRVAGSCWQQPGY